MPNKKQLEVLHQQELRQDLHRESAEAKKRNLLIGQSLKPGWLLVVLKFQFCDLEAFIDLGFGLLMLVATSLEPAQSNGLLV